MNYSTINSRLDSLTLVVLKYHVIIIIVISRITSIIIPTVFLQPRTNLHPLFSHRFRLGNKERTLH